MKLYKYLVPDRSDVLSELTIRFTPPRCFNDPFELFPVIEGALGPGGVDFIVGLALEQLRSDPDEIVAITKASIQELAPGVDLTPMMAVIEEAVRSLSETELRDMVAPYVAGLDEAARRNGFDDVRRRFDEQLGILCLTEHPDSLLMWAHYADSHRGFALEFDAEHEFFDQRREPLDPIRHVAKVRYRATRPKLNYLTPIGDPLANFLELASEVFLTKGLDWLYEDEWRFLLPLSAASIRLEREVEAVHLFAIPAAAIRRIIIGARASDATAERIIAALQSRPDCGHVTVTRAVISRDQFRVLVEDE